MKKTVIFVTAIMMVTVMACAVHAKSNGSFGMDCASCHQDLATDRPAPTEPPVIEPPVIDPPATDPPVTDPPVTDPPATDPPATDPPVTDPPATDPPVTDPPVTDPPATDPPAAEPPVIDAPADELQGIEITTIWDYNIVDGEADLSYVFFTIIETDNTVNLVELITPAGTVLQLTQEASTQLDDIVTRFADEGDTFVWECEARFDDIKQLAAYGKGNFTIATITDEVVTETTIKYHPPKASVKRPKRKDGVRTEEREDDDDEAEEEEDDD